MSSVGERIVHDAIYMNIPSLCDTKMRFKMLISYLTPICDGDEASVAICRRAMSLRLPMEDEDVELFNMIDKWLGGEEEDVCSGTFDFGEEDEHTPYLTRDNMWLVLRDMCYWNGNVSLNMRSLIDRLADSLVVE